jgi:DNA-directed RNA polymerase subunit M/transcription elongation factor TFIIS
MSIFDQIDEHGHSLGSNPHPQDGLLHKRVLIIVEEGKETPEHAPDVYVLKRYENVTLDMIGGELPNGQVIIEDTWETVERYYNKMRAVFHGAMTQEEFDEELKSTEVTGSEGEVIGTADEDEKAEDEEAKKCPKCGKEEIDVLEDQILSTKYICYSCNHEWLEQKTDETDEVIEVSDEDQAKDFEEMFSEARQEAADDIARDKENQGGDE